MCWRQPCHNSPQKAEAPWNTPQDAPLSRSSWYIYDLALALQHRRLLAPKHIDGNRFLWNHSHRYKPVFCPFLSLAEEPRDTLGVSQDTVLGRSASFFSGNIEFFQRIPNTMSWDPKVGSTLLLGGIWKIGDVLLQCLIIKGSRTLGPRCFTSQRVFSSQPLIDDSSRDAKPSWSCCFTTAISNEVKHAFAEIWWITHKIEKIP